MTQKSIKELEAERERLIKELERAKLENRFLNTMIDIAEEQGLMKKKITHFDTYFHVVV